LEGSVVESPCVATHDPAGRGVKFLVDPGEGGERGTARFRTKLDATRNVQPQESPFGSGIPSQLRGRPCEIGAQVRGGGAMANRGYA